MKSSELNDKSEYIDENGMALIVEKRVWDGDKIKKDWHQCQMGMEMWRWGNRSLARQIRSMTKGGKWRMEKKGLPYKIEYRISIGIPNETFACPQCGEFRYHNNNSFVCEECFLKDNPDSDDLGYSRYRRDVDKSISR